MRIRLLTTAAISACILATAVPAHAGLPSTIDQYRDCNADIPNSSLQRECANEFVRGIGQDVDDYRDCNADIPNSSLQRECLARFLS